jgi:hypothetical protein
MHINITNAHYNKLKATIKIHFKCKAFYLLHDRESGTQTSGSAANDKKKWGTWYSFHSLKKESEQPHIKSLYASDNCENIVKQRAVQLVKCHARQPSLQRGRHDFALYFRCLYFISRGVSMQITLFEALNVCVRHFYGACAISHSLAAAGEIKPLAVGSQKQVKR